MAVSLCQLIVLVILFATSLGQPDDDEESKLRLRQLYTVLRNIALPSAETGKVVDKRFVLMMPGKVLSERDYYPGDAYVNFKRNPSVGKLEEIPPVVMQRMFRLVDIIPGLDPMQGQESGERMSIIYRQILGDMNIKGIKHIAKDKKNLQKESIDFLLKAVKDPDDAEAEATRWDLYRRYEKIYNEKKREMEETIDNNRNGRTSVDYQLWFQRSYPILQAEVDGAFIDWLVKGKKNVVELYHSRLDTSSPGTLLLEAKSVMRSSGTVSLDRTETIYPVEYTPGDWFEYLKDPASRLSADQILLRIGMLEAQLIVLASVEDHKCDTSEAESAANTRHETDQSAIGTLSNSMMSDRCKCIIKDDEKACDKYSQNLAVLKSNITNSGMKYLVLETVKAVQQNPEGIAAMKEGIRDRISILRDDLAKTGQGIPQLATVATEKPTYDDKWLHFSYDSKFSKSIVAHSSSYTSFSGSSRLGWGWFSGSGSGSYSKQTRNDFSSFKNTQVKVSGQILRVGVQMPWFRPEMFRNVNLYTPNYQVSPGPFATDQKFVTAAQDSQHNYRIPHYLTGLLLARNLNLEFSGMDRQSSYNFVATSLSARGKLGWGPISVFKGRSSNLNSYNRNAQDSRFEATSTETGIRVRVPGVQLIGYYTQITPKFPISD